MPTKIQVEIIQEHLPYEIDMLRETYQQLAAIPPPSDVMKNALIESFCVHARSLLYFFANKKGRPDDSVAGDFTNGFSARIDVSKGGSLHPLYTKLNKQIFHLTEDRTIVDADKFDPGTDGTLALQEIEQEIGRFTPCLTSDFQPLFNCRTSPLTVPTSGSPGPTNHTSSLSWSSPVPMTGPTGPLGPRPPAPTSSGGIP